jgi:hypothetical protein
LAIATAAMATTPTARNAQINALLKQQHDQ